MTDDDHDESSAPDAWHPWYDKAFGFVVRADNERAARELAAANGGDEDRPKVAGSRAYDYSAPNNPSPWLDPAQATCEPLIDGEAGLVMCDFHAA
jgi:hypothetical protein